MSKTGRLVYNGMHERLVLIRGVGSPDLKIAHLFGFDVRKRGGKSARQNEHFRLGGNVQNFSKRRAARGWGTHLTCRWRRSLAPSPPASVVASAAGMHPLRGGEFKMSRRRGSRRVCSQSAPAEAATAAPAQEEQRQSRVARDEEWLQPLIESRNLHPQKRHF